MKHIWNRIAALLLTAVLLCGVFPAVSAAGVAGFGDVQESDWFAPYVQYVSDHKLMNGTENGFEPDGSCTRAMAAVVIYRSSGDKKPAGRPSFTDLTQDWYRDGVTWAQEKGVVNGVGDHKFDPDGTLTREQLVTMLWRYSGEKKFKTDFLKGFPDAGEIDSWAKDAFNWAIALKIIGGSDGKLLPQDSATRAQFAKIISVFQETGKNAWADGTYRIGRDLPAGEYLFRTASDSDSAYVKVCKDSAGNKIILNDIFHHSYFAFLEEGQSVIFENCVCMPASEHTVPVLKKNPCTISAGMYRVGRDIPAGTYSLTLGAHALKGYYTVYTADRSGTTVAPHRIRDDFKDTASVTVKDGEYLYLQACIGTRVS